MISFYNILDMTVIEMENREDLAGFKEETRWVGSGYACKREMGGTW